MNMKKKIVTVSLLALAISCNTAKIQTKSTSKPSVKRVYSKLVVFGDGLSDQGRFGRLTDNRYPPSPPFDRGRWTNGPTWIEHLAKLANIPLAAEENYAQGGATTGWFNINEPMRKPLGLGPDVPIRGVLAQIDAALAATPKLDPDALYVVWAGGHDIGSWLDYGQPDIVAQPPAENIREGLLRLASAGARHIFLGTMPDMGATAIYAGTEKSSRATEATKKYNIDLNEVAEEMRAKGLDVILFDGGAAFGRAWIEAPKLGIKRFDEAYLPIDYIDFANPLSPAKPVPEGRNPLEFFSFWAVSAGAKVHEALASYAYEALQTAESH
jgi:phospholipase/lecithinase/hemolysin